jgi:hypothetical protein
MCTEQAAEVNPREQAQALANVLSEKGFATAVLTKGGHQRHPCVHAANRMVSRMAEDIYVAPAEGQWFFWWSWCERIGTIHEVDKVAHIVTYVLDPFGQSAGQA